MTTALRRTVTTIIGREPTWLDGPVVAFASTAAPTSGTGTALQSIGFAATKAGAHYIYRVKQEG